MIWFLSLDKTWVAHEQQQIRLSSGLSLGSSLVRFFSGTSNEGQEVDMMLRFFVFAYDEVFAQERIPRS